VTTGSVIGVEDLPPVGEQQDQHGADEERRSGVEQERDAGEGVIDGLVAAHRLPQADRDRDDQRDDRGNADQGDRLGQVAAQ
jgi:hypothetical protein